MPRTGRIILPYYPHHIVQRGHNRQVVFAEARDVERYLATLTQFKDEYGVKVYAYCLMTNHVHLLVAPDTIAGLGQLMKRLAGRQTRYHNILEGRRGTLWESRYKSSPVDTDAYLLACTRYIELNPVRARMATSPEQYPWSSAKAHLGQTICDWLDRNPAYQALAQTDDERQARYRQFLEQAIPNAELTFIRDALQRGQLTGGSRFIDEVAAILGRRIEHRAPGRPRKDKLENNRSGVVQ